MDTCSWVSIWQAMCTTLVLVMPNFSKPFTIESDACDNGLGAVLLQDEHPIVFTSKYLSGKNLSASAYEKKMMAILHAIQKWWPYLLGNPCCIKTNHQSLKYFLEQWVSSPTQHKWVSKLKGYDYEINYKKAKDNLVVDTLFHNFDAPCLSFRYCYAYSNLVTICSARLCQWFLIIWNHPTVGQ